MFPTVLETTGPGSNKFKRYSLGGGTLKDISNIGVNGTPFDLGHVFMGKVEMYLSI